MVTTICASCDVGPLQLCGGQQGLADLPLAIAEECLAQGSQIGSQNITAYHPSYSTNTKLFSITAVLSHPHYHRNRVTSKELRLLTSLLSRG